MNFAKAILMLIIVGGCSPVSLMGQAPTIVSSNPKAQALRSCANGVDVFTPGISPQAALGLVWENVEMLGETPEEAMRRCLELLQVLK